jgi:long-subunit acyl-CoA synthetase (AMP-forming)
MKKLQNGEFIAPSKLESIYVNAPLVDRIYIDVNSNYNFLVAIVHLNQEKLIQYA